jgi:hypothetical protein
MQRQHGPLARYANGAEREEASDPTAMSDNDLHLLVEQLEAEIEELRETAQNCGKWILASKLAMAVAGAWLVAIAMGVIGVDPTALVLAIALMLGGIVLAGSNASTLRRTLEALNVKEAQRMRAIDGAGLAIVETIAKPRQIH